jgi:transposase-like protein
MEKKGVMLTNANVKIEEMEGVRRTTGISSIAEPQSIRGLRMVSDLEVSEKPVRRRFTAEYKRRILREAAFCKERGQLGALLRREGLYSSNLTAWQRQAERGSLEALSPKKRGPKEQRRDPSVRRIAELEKENQNLRHTLRQACLRATLGQAKMIIEAQKKIAEILQTPPDQNEERSS